jgi:hypothetical protein
VAILEKKTIKIIDIFVFIDYFKQSFITRLRDIWDLPRIRGNLRLKTVN